MKNIFCFFLWTLTFSLSAQFSDNFNDGDFTANPVWTGDEDSFEVSGNILHLNAPANNAESYISANSLASIDGFWEFTVKLDFNPSNSNKLLVYIMSDSSNLKGWLNGYYLQIGGSNDQIDLYRQDGLTRTLLLEGTSNLLDLNQVDVKVKIDRNNQGLFQLHADTSLGFNNYLFQGQSLDFTYTNSNYFGFKCDYTATRSDKFWMDDIVITAQEYLDTQPPILLSVTVNALDEIVLNFNEVLDSTMAISLSNYSMTNNAVYAVQYAGNQLHLDLQKELLNNETSGLQVTLEDLIGNQLDTSINLLIEDNFEFQSLLLNEIYPDESPSFGMPNGEFVEIFNPSNDTISLLNWKIADSKDTSIIPNDTILPGAYIILCKSSSFLPYTSFGKTIAVPSMPSLNNSDDKIMLLNAYDKVVDSVFYSNYWYREIMDSLGNEKKNGGYSLERIGVQNSCANFYNWFPSNHFQGASPGQENSITNFTFPPTEVEIVNLLIEDDTTLLFTFSEEIPGITVNNCFIDLASIEQVYQANNKQLYILLEEPLEKGKIYQLDISDVVDCYLTSIAAFSYNFYINEPAVPGDIIFNEVLFNPRVGGSDYIEFYNTSSKAIDLKDFVLVEYDVFNPTEVEDSIVLESFVIAPKEHLVLSEDIAHVLGTYIVEYPENLISHDIPNLNDDESILALYLPNSTLADSLYYHKSWHLELLDVLDGVALERISPEGQTTASSNWYSAAKTYGYGTPTALNSQNYQEHNLGEVLVSTEVFTPNEDGYKDFCTIQYNSQGSGEVINVKIYDVLGREVKLIAQNHSVGVINSWVWGGLNNNFEKADVGIYVVVLEVFDVDGKRKRYKEKLVLGAQLN